MASRFSQRGRAGRILLALAGTCGFSTIVAGQATQDHRVPVLVELFTSEGCSDCPPADELLARLDAAQPVPGAQAIVLSEHVTYWNREGWNDPFSLDAIDLRQRDYVERFRLQDSYTPQTVVDGAAQMVGNSAPSVVHAVTEAAQNPKQPLAISDARWADGGATFAVHGNFDPKARLFAVLAADATHSEVSRGENAGRTLHHVAVVRVMKEFGGDSADGRAMKLAGGPLDHKSEASGQVRLVVFAVDRKTGHVIAAAEQILQR
jgi:hypothetical protein